MKFAASLIVGAALTAAALGVTTPAHATKQKVTVVGVPADQAHIANTKCIAPMFCFSKKRGSYSYDPGVWGNAKFRTGEVTLRDGTTLAGRVALLNLAADWNFVKQYILVIPEGEVDAIFIGRQDAILIKQETKKGTDVYDRYEGSYLRRRVSGPMRLSYNPAAGTSRSISEFVPVSVVNNISGAAGRQAVISALRDGKSIGDSLAAGKNVGDVLGEALSSIEITDKEYLLYDEQQDQLTAITKQNYPIVIQNLFASCGAVDAKTVKSFGKKYKKIDEAVIFYNSNCT